MTSAPFLVFGISDGGTWHLGMGKGGVSSPSGCVIHTKSGLTEMSWDLFNMVVEWAKLEQNGIQLYQQT